MSFLYKSENIHAFVLKPEMETFGIKSEFYHMKNPPVMIYLYWKSGAF